MKKRLLSIVCALFLCFSVFLAGCKDKGLRDNPPTGATVISNGGMSVIKGDYLYFVNGYEDKVLTKDDNKMGKITKGAIYRTKLDDHDISKDKDGFLNNADLVVSKIVGFANGGFEIIDDYIFYATPYMKLASNGSLQTGRIEIHRIDIDGTDDEVIYVTENAETDLDWTMRKVGDKICLLIHDGTKIVSVNANNGDVIGSVDGVTSYSFLHESVYQHDAQRTKYNETHVYYTRAITEDDNVINYKGNALCSFDIASGEIRTLELSRTNTYVIKHVTNDTLYYTYTNVGLTTACLYKRVVNNAWTNSTEQQLTYRAFTNYYFADYGNDLIIATTDSHTFRLEGGLETEPVQILGAARTLIGLYGDYGYYANENNLIRFNIWTGELQDAYDGSVSLLTNDSFLDFDNRRIFLFSQYTAENGDLNYYLNYFAEGFEEKEDFKQRFVGVFDEDDVPAKPEQPEPEYEGDEVEYVPHID